MKLSIVFKPVLLVLLGILLVLSVGVVASNSDKTITIAQEATMDGLDPYLDNTTTTNSALGNVYDALTARTADGEVVPGLATSWERLDQTTWRFELREGVEFSNGNEFTAEDVRFSFQRMGDFQKSEWQFIGESVTSVKIIDDYTVEITTNDPFPTFAGTIYFAYMMDKDWTEAHDPGYIATHAMGTGPYKVAEWEMGDHLTLVVNENYWGETPSIDKAVIKPITEVSTRLAALETGSVDLITNVPFQSIQVVEENPNAEVIAAPGRRVIFLGMNQREGVPTSNQKVREAMYTAINEEEIIDRIMQGYATSANQLTAPPDVGYNPNVKRPEPNIEKAKELLEEAGYPDGFEITLDVPYDRYVKDEQIGQAVVSYLQKAGINAKLETRTKSIHFDLIIGSSSMLEDPKTDFFMMGWRDSSFDAARPHTLHVRTVNPDKGYGTWNAGRHSNPELDQLLREAAKEVDPEKRIEILKEVNKVCMNNVAVIPLHIQYDIYGAATNADFTPRADRWILVKDISLE